MRDKTYHAYLDIGRGTALTGVWNGVPASYRGVPTSAAIWTAALCRNLQAA